MRQLFLLSIILLLNGCSQKIPDCQPVPCKQQECLFPKMPSYKTPASNKITKPKDLGDGTCVVVIDELLELHRNNKKLREICWKYDSVNKRVNSKYQNKRKKI